MSLEPFDPEQRMMFRVVVVLCLTAIACVALMARCAALTGGH